MEITARAAPPPGVRGSPMNIYSYPLTLLDVPADLRADPDGDWTYESLVAAAGLDPEASPPPIVAALFEPWRGHPEGAAVVACPGDGQIAIIHSTSAVPSGAPPHARFAGEQVEETVPERRERPARSVGRAA